MMINGNRPVYGSGADRVVAYSTIIVVVIVTIIIVVVVVVVVVVTVYTPLAVYTKQ